MIFSLFGNDYGRFIEITTFYNISSLESLEVIRIEVVCPISPTSIVVIRSYLATVGNSLNTQMLFNPELKEYLGYVHAMDLVVNQLIARLPMLNREYIVTVG